MTDEFLTITQLAARLGVSEKVMRRYVQAGAIRYYTIGQVMRFRAADIEAWLTALASRDPAKYPATHPVTTRI